MNFRKLYKSIEDLVKDEDNDRFPPHFRLKLVNRDNTSSLSTLTYEYTICIQSKKKKDELLGLNISGLGHHPPRGL